MEIEIILQDTIIYFQVWPYWQDWFPLQIHYSSRQLTIGVKHKAAEKSKNFKISFYTISAHYILKHPA